MRLLVSSAESNLKVSVLLEALEPVLAVAEETLPHTIGLQEKQRLLANSRQAFGTQVLASRLNRLASRSTESIYCFLMGMVFGIAVEADGQGRKSCTVGFCRLMLHAFKH